MADYFEISLLSKKKPLKNSDTASLVKSEFNLQEGKNDINDSRYLALKQKTVLFSVLDDEETDYTEITVGFHKQVFHRHSFEKEISLFSVFVDNCFKLDDRILYALASYELNGYLLGSIRELKEIGDAVLSKFPLVYTKKTFQNSSFISGYLKHCNLRINYQAQELF